MTHDDAWHLIPWFVNGSLRKDVRGAIDAHLAACAECRSEVAMQMRVRDGVLQEDARPETTQSSFDQLWSRIEAHDGAEDPESEALPVLAPAAPMKPPAARAAGMPKWLVAAVVVQAVGLGVLGWVTFNAPRAADYRTLSSSPAPITTGGQIRAVFAPELELRDLQALLASSKLTIVAGPTESGVYTLAPTEANADVGAALTGLRQSASVRFAEPIGDPQSASP